MEMRNFGKYHLIFGFFGAHRKSKDLGSELENIKYPKLPFSLSSLEIPMLEINFLTLENERLRRRT